MTFLEFSLHFIMWFLQISFVLVGLPQSIEYASTNPISIYPLAMIIAMNLSSLAGYVHYVIERILHS